MYIQFLKLRNKHGFCALSGLQTGNQFVEEVIFELFFILLEFFIDGRFVLACQFIYYVHLFLIDAWLSQVVEHEINDEFRQILHSLFEAEWYYLIQESLKHVLLLADHEEQTLQFLWRFGSKLLCHVSFDCS